MTVETFIRWVEDYYGKYRPVVKQEAITWLSEKPAHYIAGLREYVRDHFQTNWGKPPDVAAFVEFHQHACQEIYDRGREALAASAEKSRRIGTATPGLKLVDSQEATS